MVKTYDICKSHVNKFFLPYPRITLLACIVGPLLTEIFTKNPKILHTLLNRINDVTGLNLKP
jgi:hypothetical protein